jgi:hypothetical protein
MFGGAVAVTLQDAPGSACWPKGGGRAGLVTKFWDQENQAALCCEPGVSSNDFTWFEGSYPQGTDLIHKGNEVPDLANKLGFGWWRYPMSGNKVH